MEDLKVQYVNLEHGQNQQSHGTVGLSSKTLVVRRGQPFKISLLFQGRPFSPQTDSLMLRILLGRLYVRVPVTFSKHFAQSQWSAHFKPDSLNPRTPQSATVYVCPPASAPVGVYHLQVAVLSHSSQHIYKVGQFSLLCNPWCQADSVYLPSETQREEFVTNDFGLLYMGTHKNVISRPWSFDQYESGILEVCMKLLQLSPQHSMNGMKDYLRRSDPVYISRVVSAMINSQDDRGVLRGNWSGDYSSGVHPSKWTGSADILQQWAKSSFSPVKYGQCWVFAAVMCTVMRVLGIPSRVITNFNSAHDTNGNLVIEEFYSETGKKLAHSKDSIWNFHVWVECWMNRPDLGSGFDGWQVLDPTPQERSGGVFCCGPAPVEAIRDRRVDLVYDIPFVFAEVNADVHAIVVRNGQVLSHSTDTERVGALICTKSVGSNKPQNVTAHYKHIKDAVPSNRSRSATPMSGHETVSRISGPGLSVSLRLLKAPVAGENISFSVTITNTENTLKTLREHVNAQAKEYNHSPADTFWETHSVIQIAPYQGMVIQHQIPHGQYEALLGEDLVNLAVVVEDTATQERVLVSEEFNIDSPQITMQIAGEGDMVPHREYVAMVVFTNPFTAPVSGMLTVMGSGLLEGKVHSRILLLQPGETMEKAMSFTPKMAGVKMLHASLMLNNNPAVIRGFRTVTVRAA